MNPYEQKLEFDAIREQLAAFAMTDWAKEQCRTLTPSLSEREVARRLEMTTAARDVLDRQGTPPLVSMSGLRERVALACKGGLLAPDDLTQVDSFAAACERMKRYLARDGDRTPLGGVGASIVELDTLRDAIARCIRNGLVADEASSALRDVRRRIESVQTQIRSRCESLLRGHPEWFADSYVATRMGRLTLPVKREYRAKVDGSAVDASQTGATVFVEPASVRRLQEQRAELAVEEDNEVRRVLYELSGMVADDADRLRLDCECMETLDFLFARGKLSLAMRANPVPAVVGGTVDLRRAVHPLLDRANAVPLDLAFGGETRGVVVTGPNTGGKTVALKTVGLLSLMAQSGLHIPADPGSRLPMVDAVYADIGDGQSIAECLSTFSSHITSITAILQKATRESLVLLDEVGSGTDPAEGMGLAVAILGALADRGCLFVATTHYPEVKAFAERRGGMMNARMAFDRESLRPLFLLEQGVAGESCALYIAERLGFPPALLAIAREAAGSRPAPETETQTASAVEPEPAADIPAPPSVATITRPKTSALKAEKAAPVQTHAAKFGRGDSVMVYPSREIGIVSRAADERGELLVFVKDKERTVMHKRLKLLAPAEQMYPPDYDFSIVFDTVANRKARHDMGRKHDPNAVIIHNGGDAQ